MIRIDVKTARPKPGIDLATPICNNAAEQIGERLKKELRNTKCDAHPNSNPTIRVIATPHKKHLFEVQKIGFCCKKFEDSIEIRFS